MCYFRSLFAFYCLTFFDWQVQACCGAGQRGGGVGAAKHGLAKLTPMVLMPCRANAAVLLGSSAVNSQRWQPELA